MEICLIRHTAPAKQPDLCYGRLDLALAAPVQPAINRVVERVTKSGTIPSLILSSPLQRCQVLAQALATHYQATLRLDERWVELNFGDWEGQSWSNIDRHQSDAWAQNYWQLAPPNGETYQALQERVHAALDALVDEPEQSIVVVSHVGPIRAAVAYALGEVSRTYPDYSIDYGRFVRLQRREHHWHVAAINQ